MQVMIARRLSLVVLGIIISVMWMGCQTADQEPAGNQKIRPAVQNRDGPKVVRSRLDDDLISVRLLMVEMVQADLGLMPDQIGKLRDLAKISKERSQKFLARLREIFPASQSFPPEEFEVRKQKYRELSKGFLAEGMELRTKAFAILSASQSERLKQIEIQATVPAVFVEPEILKKLDISKEQCTAIRKLCDQADQKQSGEWPDLRGLDLETRRQKVIEFMKESNMARAEATDRILEMLSPEQQAKFQELQGKKIDITQLSDAMIPENMEF